MLVFGAVVTMEVGYGSGWLPPAMNGSESWSALDTRYCYVEGRVYDCVRISVLLVMGVVTGLVSLLRVLQYHCYRARNYHLYLVYYTALLICLLSMVHWAYLWTPIIDLVTTYLMVIQMLIIAWFFCSWAFRILQKEKLFTYLVVPVLVGVALYFSGSLVWASVKSSSVIRECAEPQWLLYSASLLVLVQFFLLCVLYISKKLNDVRTMKTNRCSQKAQLWGLTVTYEIVSLASLAYDIYLRVTRSVDGECGTNFGSDGVGVGVAIMYVLHKFVKYLLPQLVIAAVFAPLKARPVKFQHELGETDTISWAEKPDYKSTFNSPTTYSSNPVTSPSPHLINTSVVTPTSTRPPVTSTPGLLPPPLQARTSIVRSSRRNINALPPLPSYS